MLSERGMCGACSRAYRRRMSWIHWHVVAVGDDGQGTFIGRFADLQSAEAESRDYAEAAVAEGWTAEANAYGIALSKGAVTAQLAYTSCADSDCD